ncbi:MAG: hypothetical protein QOG43_2654 [Actinomycetota bacterium]|jgi:hypothetical protein|nr:hypothetical protein [Actinomycetota bacterium]
MSQSPEQALRGLRDALSALAQTLYEAENSPDLVFVKAQAEAAGPSSPAAAAVVDNLAGLWDEYPRAQDVVERLDGAVAAGRHDEVAELLGPNGVALADGSTRFVGALIDDLQARAEKVVREAGRLAAAARTALARLDAASAAIRGLVKRAAPVGGADDVEVEAAATALGEATSALAADPTATEPLAALDRALAAAARRVDELERAQAGFPAALAGARSELAEIRRLVRVGTDAAALARVKIADPTGLLDPLDASGVDGPTALALGPWLDHIEAAARAGGGPAAAASDLDRWRRKADGWLADARRVATANGAAVARRNELRGLLQAFRAKSLAMGRAEDPDLVALHHAAEQALYTAPCDLGQAERLVGEYLRAVNATVPEGRR